MGTRVHWTKGEHPLSVVANVFNMVSPTLSGAATAATIFTGGIVAVLGDTTAGLAMLATALPQVKFFSLNRKHSRHTIARLQAMQNQPMIERETRQEAGHRCALAFARLAAPLVIFGAGYGLAKLVEPLQPPEIPAPVVQQVTAPEV